VASAKNIQFEKAKVLRIFAMRQENIPENSTRRFRKNEFGRKGFKLTEEPKL
jgi:hypothetical protein